MVGCLVEHRVVLGQARVAAIASTNNAKQASGLGFAAPTRGSFAGASEARQLTFVPACLDDAMGAREESSPVPLAGYCAQGNIRIIRGKPTRSQGAGRRPVDVAA